MYPDKKMTLSTQIIPMLNIEDHSGEKVENVDDPRITNCPSEIELM